MSVDPYRAFRQFERRGMLRGKSISWVWFDDFGPPKEDWRSDVWPKFVWRIVRDAFQRAEEPGMFPPVGYGYAYTDWATNRDFFMPVPLNVIVAAARLAWSHLRYPRFAADTKMRAGERNAYHRGWGDGQRDLMRRGHVPALTAYLTSPVKARRL